MTTDAPQTKQAFHTGGIVPTPDIRITTNLDGPPRPAHPVQTSRQETILYGEYAGMVRRLGDTTAALADARNEASRLEDDAARYDPITGGPRDDEDRSPETAKRASIQTRVAQLEADALAVYAELAAECATNQAGRRKPDQSD